MKYRQLNELQQPVRKYLLEMELFLLLESENIVLLCLCFYIEEEMERHIFDKVVNLYEHVLVSKD